MHAKGCFIKNYEADELNKRKLKYHINLVFCFLLKDQHQ